MNDIQCFYRFYENSFAYSCKKLGPELRSVVRKDFCRYPEVANPQLEENCRYCGCSCFGIALVSFDNWSFITTIYWFPLLLFRKGPNMSLAMNSSGPIAGNNRNYCCFSCFLLMCARFAVLEGSVAVFCHVWSIIFGAHYALHASSPWLTC